MSSAARIARNMSLAGILMKSGLFNPSSETQILIELMTIVPDERKDDESCRRKIYFANICAAEFLSGKNCSHVAFSLQTAKGALQVDRMRNTFNAKLEHG